VNVLEQNYEYDLLEPDKLLRKYVGRDVILARRRSENGQARDEEVKARLLSCLRRPSSEWRLPPIPGFPGKWRSRQLPDSPPANSDKSFAETQLCRDQMTAIMPASRGGVRARAGHTGWLTGNWRQTPI